MLALLQFVPAPAQALVMRYNIIDDVNKQVSQGSEMISVLLYSLLHLLSI